MTRGFRLGQIVSGSLFSLSHGTNDAQKTMGIIFLALVANGNLQRDRRRPDLGHPLGRHRDRARHLCRRLADHQDHGHAHHQDGPGAGLRRPGRGAAVILSASHVGFPLSTTHVISGAIMGAGAAKRLSAVRWGVAGNIVIAWVLTLPASAAVGGLTYAIVAPASAPTPRARSWSPSAAGGARRAFARRLAAGRTLTAEG